MNGNSPLFALLSAGETVANPSFEEEREARRPKTLPEARVIQLREAERRHVKRHYAVGELVTYPRDVGANPGYVGEPAIVLQYSEEGCTCHPENRYLVAIVDQDGDIVAQWTAAFRLEPYTA